MEYGYFLGDILKEMIIMPICIQPKKEESLKRGLIKSQVCDSLKEAIKNESDYEHKYAKIKEDMPIEYMEYYADLDIIRANRGRDKIRLMEIVEKIGCSL